MDTGLQEWEVANNMAICNEIIEKISIDKNGCLNIKPKQYSFDMIYRSASGVRWDAQERYLYTIASLMDKSVTIKQMYRQIILAVNDEYGISLNITEETVFENITNDDITNILN